MNSIPTQDMTLATRILLVQAGGKDRIISAQEQKTLPIRLQEAMDQVRSEAGEDPSVTWAETFLPYSYRQQVEKVGGPTGQFSAQAIEKIKDQQFRLCMQTVFDTAATFSQPYQPGLLTNLSDKFENRKAQALANDGAIDKKELGLLRKEVLKQMQNGDQRPICDAFLAELDALNPKFADKKTQRFSETLSQEFTTRALYIEAGQALLQCLEKSDQVATLPLLANVDRKSACVVDSTMNRGVMLSVPNQGLDYSQREDLRDQLELFQALTPQLHKYGAIWFTS